MCVFWWVLRSGVVEVRNHHVCHVGIVEGVRPEAHIAEPSGRHRCHPCHARQSQATLHRNSGRSSCTNLLPYYLFSPTLTFNTKYSRFSLSTDRNVNSLLLRCIARSLWIQNLVSISSSFRNANMSEWKWISGVDIESLLIHALQGLVCFLF